MSRFFFPQQDLGNQFFLFETSFQPHSNCNYKLTLSFNFNSNNKYKKRVSLARGHMVIAHIKKVFRTSLSVFTAYTFFSRSCLPSPSKWSSKMFLSLNTNLETKHNLNLIFRKDDETMSEPKKILWTNFASVLSTCLVSPLFHYHSKGISCLYPSPIDKFKHQPKHNCYAELQSRLPQSQCPCQKLIETMFHLLPTLSFGIFFPVILFPHCQTLP